MWGSGCPQASGVGVGGADYLGVRIPGREKGAQCGPADRGSQAGKGGSQPGKGARCGSGSALTLLVTSAPLNSGSACGAPPCFRASRLFLHLLPPPPPPPPAGGLDRFTEPRVQTFRCLLAASCLCRKMLVPRTASFRPALATAPAAAHGFHPPEPAAGGSATGTGLGAARLARQGEQPRAPAAGSRPRPALCPRHPNGCAALGPPHLPARCLPPAEEGTQGPASLPGVSQPRTRRRQEYMLFTTKYSENNV